VGALSIVTGIDLPWGSPGGSMILLNDLYTARRPFDATVFTLPAAGPGPEPGRIRQLTVPGAKEHAGPGFWAWTEAVARALERELRGADLRETVVHCQHLAFGTTPALIMALPRTPRIGLVHGTDLIYAAQHPTQLAVLRHAAAAMDAIVAPTGAMAEWLLRLAPATPARKITTIPWGIPDHLLTRPISHPRRTDGPLRILFAGRMSSEKGAGELIRACRRLDEVELGLIGPADGHRTLLPLLAEKGHAVRYLGYLPREQLWERFAHYDVLAVPSTVAEAFCLTAIEAQACGLPVLYQPVPRLLEVLGDSGLPVDFTASAAFTATVKSLVDDRGQLRALRAQGAANARRYPLSTTTDRLAELTATVLGRPSVPHQRLRSAQPPAAAYRLDTSI